VGEIPFESDKLGKRKEFAEKLTKIVENLTDGGVIGIDSEWGKGKTWFGLNWKEYLKEKEFKVVRIDAFERDYVKDPFIIIAAEIKKLIEQEDVDKSKEFLKTASAVVKNLAPAAAKVIVKVVGGVALNSLKIDESIVNEIKESFSENAKEYVYDRLETYDEDQKSFDSFKKRLSEFVSIQEKPVIFIIDELDRCRPDFVVLLIERLKHLFEVPNLIFILLLNRKQLQSSIAGVYGSGIDSHAYLEKFVYLFFDLPDGWLPTSEFIEEVSSRYRVSEVYTKLIYYTFPFIHEIYDLTLRDAEKIVSLVTLLESQYPLIRIASINIAALKIKKPDLYTSIRKKI